MVQTPCPSPLALLQPLDVTSSGDFTDLQKNMWQNFKKKTNNKNTAKQT